MPTGYKNRRCRLWGDDERPTYSTPYPMEALIARLDGESPHIPAELNTTRCTPAQLAALNTLFRDIKEHAASRACTLMAQLLEEPAHPGEDPPGAYQRGLRSIILQRLWPGSPASHIPWGELHRHYHCDKTALFAAKKDILTILRRLTR